MSGSSPADEIRHVMRMFYLPPDLDERLRVLAFRQGRPANDIVCEALRAFLEGPVSGAEAAEPRVP